jgi:hypothetical protein
LLRAAFRSESEERQRGKDDAGPPSLVPSSSGDERWAVLFCLIQGPQPVVGRSAGPLFAWTVSLTAAALSRLPGCTWSERVERPSWDCSFWGDTSSRRQRGSGSIGTLAISQRHSRDLEPTNASLRVA